MCLGGKDRRVSMKPQFYFHLLPFEVSANMVTEFKEGFSIKEVGGNMRIQLLRLIGMNLMPDAGSLAE